MKAKKVQLTLAFGMLAMVLVALFLPKHRQLDSRWNQYAQFLRQADSVQTVATTFDFFPFKNPPADIEKYLNAKAPNERSKVQNCNAAMREKILACLAQITNQQDMTSDCFCPHHFVIAVKGNQKVILSICFNCESCIADGGIHVEAGVSKSAIHDASNAFGIDIATDIEASRCYFNDGVSGKLPR